MTTIKRGFPQKFQRVIDHILDKWRDNGIVAGYSKGIEPDKLPEIMYTIYMEGDTSTIISLGAEIGAAIKAAFYSGKRVEHTLENPFFQNSCPVCKTKFDGHISSEPGHVPEPGDATHCDECYAILIFGEKIQLHEASPEEIEVLRIENPESYQALLTSISFSKEYKRKKSSCCPSCKTQIPMPELPDNVRWQDPVLKISICPSCYLKVYYNGTYGNWMTAPEELLNLVFTSSPHTKKMLEDQEQFLRAHKIAGLKNAMNKQQN